MAKIVLLITQMEAAGAQRSMMQIARGLSQKGWEVCCVTFYDKGGYCSFFEKNYGVRIIDLKAWRSNAAVFVNLITVMRGLFRLFGLLRKMRPDVLHGFTHYSNILGVTVAWFAGVPVRISRQAISTDKLPRWFQAVDRFMANSALTSKMVAVSEHTRKDSVARQGIKAEKILAIPNAPELDAMCDGNEDFRKEFGLPSSAIVALVVARLHRLKGHIYLFKAYKALPREDAGNFYILCAGEGEERATLEKFIKDNDLGSRIRLIGSRKDMPRLLKYSDFMVLPSLSEGMPMSVLESLAAGCPVVAADSDGTREVLTPDCGLLVPPADTEALTAALRTMLRSDRKALGKAGRARIEKHFSLQRQIDRYEALYHSFMH
ncbi:MAG: glycosyltransferase [Alphaproteobacteria bacterium]|nr:glycosyltransferase [Alphaproteobacteria bacterium]